MTESSFRGLLWVLALVGAVADQTSKYGVFALLYRDAAGKEPTPDVLSTRNREIIPAAFNLTAQFTGEREQGTGILAALRTPAGPMLPRVNHGALFGMASERGHVANRIFAVVSLLAAVVIIVWSTRPSLTGDWLLCAALGLILGGTIGNLYDRVVFGGVRDFLEWYYAFSWPVFNVADCCLVVGAFLLLAQAMWHRPAPVAESPPVSAEAATPSVT